jgi:hypothetical protein
MSWVIISRDILLYQDSQLKKRGHMEWVKICLHGPIFVRCKTFKGEIKDILSKISINDYIFNVNLDEFEKY